MAWNQPRTWSVTDIGSAGVLNAQIRDNMIALEKKVQCGSVNITPVANTPTSVAVTFGTAFPSTPIVVVTANAVSIGTQVIGVAVSSISTTGFTAWVDRTNTTSTTVNWIAAVELS